MTRTAAALDYAEAAVKMRRRRINKSAVHREMGLLQRSLTTFVADFNARMTALKTMTFYDKKTTMQMAMEQATKATKAKALAAAGKSKSTIWTIGPTLQREWCDGQRGECE